MRDHTIREITVFDEHKSAVHTGEPVGKRRDVVDERLFTTTTGAAYLE